MATLGCGVYEVWFKTRGGNNFVCRARNLVSFNYARILNEVSEAKVTVALNGVDGDCCDCVGNINPWEHEIAIFRDGVEVWCGPVVNAEINLTDLTATFDCKDLFTWTDNRWIEVFNADYNAEDVDASEVFQWILSHVYNKDPWNMTWSTYGQTGVVLSKFYPAYDPGERWGGTYPIAGEELRALSRSAVDFTCIRRHLICGDLSTNPPVELPLLIDRHWALAPRIVISGGTMATEVGVAGGNGGTMGWADDQIWIEGPNDEYRQRFGLLQRFTVEATLDEENTSFAPNAVAQLAYGMRELKKAPYVYVDGGELSKDAPVDFNTLIPGAVIRIALSQTCRTVEGNYRLSGVTVSSNGADETVALQLTPEGAVGLRGSGP